MCAAATNTRLDLLKLQVHCRDLEFWHWFFL